MSQKTQTIIIGGGQAGLATSYYLKQQGVEHLVLEQAAAAGNAWRNDRWDSFSLNTPNWSFRLPGAVYRGDGPDGFMHKADVVASFEQYVERFHLPVQYGAQVNLVEPLANGKGYRVQTSEEEWEVQQVVMANGLYQSPKIPSFAANLSSRITQLHSGHYRNPGLLPPGAVLVVGSAQSGSQIAEELYLSGRKVYLCTGSAGRAPRRYRGKDIYEWMHLSGFLDRTLDKLPSPQAKFAGNPHVSGRDGGRTINLHQFVRDGVTLTGHIQGGEGNTIHLAGDLKENLAKADKLEADLVKMVDDYITRKGLDIPTETLPILRDGYEVPEITELDLQVTGITTIIWAMGYRFDFSLVQLPVRDTDGFPIQKQGVTAFPGLYFVGLPWTDKMNSGLLLGVGESAEHIASQIVARRM
jgi:putative flavoprotein involved in K+ transport